MSHTKILCPGIRVLIAAVVPATGDEGRPRLERIRQCVEATGGIVVATLVQRRGISREWKPGGRQRMHAAVAIHPATYLGKGKVSELAALVATTKPDLVIFSNSLRDGQKINLEAIIGIPIFLFPQGDQADCESHSELR